jgi:hypothetical protein
LRERRGRDLRLAAGEELVQRVRGTRWQTPRVAIAVLVDNAFDGRA